MGIFRFSIAIILLTAAIIMGCSNPKGVTTLPDENIASPISMNDTDSRIMGSGTLQFDLVEKSVIVVPSRAGEFHYNITGLLRTGCPGGCFRVAILDTTNNIYKIQMTIENPTSIQVWDVRIFLFNILGKKVMNPDGFSDYYTDVTQVPFINFAKENPSRAFPVGPGGFDSEMLMLDFSGTTTQEINYLIEAGVGEQFPEPVQIDQPQVRGVFFSNYPLGGSISVFVLDHQGNAVVTMNATEIGFSNNEPLFDDGLHNDGAAGDNIFGSMRLIPTVAPGNYQIIVKAADTSGWPFITRGVRFKVYSIPQMIAIPAGTFTMGIGANDPYVNTDYTVDEKPAHPHPLDSYNIGKFEVLVREYAAFVENGGYSNPSFWSEAGWLMREDYALTKPVLWGMPEWTGPNKQDHPMVGLSWWEAEAYCIWLSQMTGQSWRLPTEPEWERAARGDADDRYYPWGFSWNDNYCNSNRDSIDTSRTSPAGLYSPQGDSPWGCADILGNAAEWTSDWYQGDIYTQYSQGNYTPPQYGSQKVIRGAPWWINNDFYLRVSFRWNRNMLDFDDGNGFRLLRENVQ